MGCNDAGIESRGKVGISKTRRLPKHPRKCPPSAQLGHAPNSPPHISQLHKNNNRRRFHLRAHIRRVLTTLPNSGNCFYIFAMQFIVVTNKVSTGEHHRLNHFFGPFVAPIRCI